LLAVAASWWLSGFALAPLSRMAVAAGQIDVATLDRRVPVRGVGDELDRVGVAFNDSLQRLGHAVAEMRQFSAALAHELRTPLAALRGGIELAMSPAATDTSRRDALASAVEEIDRLTRLIDQILTLARAESGQIHLAFVPVDLTALAAAIVEQIEPLADAGGVSVRCEPAPPVVVDGDAGWLGRLLLNLLGNAIRFTDAGGSIVVRVSRRGDHATVEVRDTGIGLAPDDADRVFERFYRADPARSSRADGAGLGLSLVKWIASEHGGTVAVDSRLGEGSTFSIRLPVRPSEDRGRAVERT
jgi:heavy metal sensor kinase